MLTTLSPTLWRTCRVLANANRLAVFRALLLDGPLSVGQVADRVSSSVSLASQHLKHLQSRGLCQATRRGARTLYELKADPLVSSATPLLAALCSALAQEGQVTRVLAALTAFTHPRRIAVVAALAKVRSASVVGLGHGLGISIAAMHRHADKLIRRGFIVRCGDLVSLASPTHPLERTLLQLATRSRVHG